MRKTVIIVLVLGTMVGTGYFLAARFTGDKQSAYEVYSLLTTVSHDGTTRSTVRLEARREDSATVLRETSFSNEGPCNAAAISLPTERKYVVTNDCEKLMSTFHLSEEQAQDLLADNSSDCRDKVGTKMTFIGRDTMHGVAVLKFTGEGPSARTELAVAPDLRCSSIKEVYYWKQNGAFSGAKTVQAAFDVRVGSAGGDLFVLPDYKEVPPSEIRNATFRRLAPKGAQAPTCFTDFNERIDRRYRDSR